MSLLTITPPESVCLVDGELMFDTECYEEPDKIYDICVSYKSVLSIFEMLNSESLTAREKQEGLLRAFYLDDIPDDYQKAAELAIYFLDCGMSNDNDKKSSGDAEPLYCWKQDGDYIYAAINQTFNNVLDTNPDLHWWKFINCFMNLNENCKFNEIIANRYAHKHPSKKDNIPTNEQRKARKMFPEIYILESERVKPDNKIINRLKEIEKMLNN